MPGKLQSQEFTSSGTFNVPLGVTAIWITMIAGGGGGGGGQSSGNAAGSGGGGEICERAMKIVPSGGTVAIVVGAAGTGGGPGNTQGGDGGNTSVDNLQVFARTLDNQANTGGLTGIFGKQGGQAGNLGGGGAGGGAGGFPANSRGSGVYNGPIGFLMDGRMGFKSSSCWQGGPQGGCGDASGINSRNGGIGANEGGYARVGPGGVGGSWSGSGASTIFGSGAAGVLSGNGLSPLATAYGAGGSAAGGTTSGSGAAGAKGYVLVQWIS